MRKRDRKLVCQFGRKSAKMPRKTTGETCSCGRQAERKPTRRERKRQMLADIRIQTRHLPPAQRHAAERQVVDMFDSGRYAVYQEPSLFGIRWFDANAETFSSDVNRATLFRERAYAVAVADVFCRLYPERARRLLDGRPYRLKIAKIELGNHDERVVASPKAKESRK